MGNISRNINFYKIDIATFKKNDFLFHFYLKEVTVPVPG